MTINWLAILLATVGGMLVGAVWFAAPVLGRPWANRAGVDTRVKTSGRVYLLALVATLATSGTLALAGAIAHDTLGGSYAGVMVTAAGVLWVGFTAARTGVEYLFERRPAMLYLIDMGHQLAVVLVMALILGFLGR